MHPRISLATLGTAALLLTPVPARAQEEAPEPGVVIVRYFECDLGRTGEAVQMMNGTWRSVVQSVIEDGMLLDYGILVHNWGDEWNLLDYFVAENSPAFFEGWGESLRRLGEADPEGTTFEGFTEICARHKDNIYGVVSPPSEEAEEEASQ